MSHDPADDEEQFKTLFAALIPDDEPESTVTPLGVLADIKRRQRTQGRRIRTAGVLVAAAAVVAFVIVPLGRNVHPSVSASSLASSSGSTAGGRGADAFAAASPSAAAAPDLARPAAGTTGSASSAAPSARAVPSSSASSAAVAAESESGGALKTSVNAAPSAASGPATGSGFAQPTSGSLAIGSSSAAEVATGTGGMAPLPPAVQAAVRAAAPGSATLGKASAVVVPCIPGGAGDRFELRVGDRIGSLVVLVVPHTAGSALGLCAPSAGQLQVTQELSGGRSLLVIEDLGGGAGGSALRALPYSSAELTMVAAAAARAME